MTELVGGAAALPSEEFNEVFALLFGTDTLSLFLLAPAAATAAKEMGAEAEHELLPPTPDDALNVGGAGGVASSRRENTNVPAVF